MNLDMYTKHTHGVLYESTKNPKGLIIWGKGSIYYPQVIKKLDTKQKIWYDKHARVAI